MFTIYFVLTHCGKRHTLRDMYAFSSVLRGAGLLGVGLGLLGLLGCAPKTGTQPPQTLTLAKPLRLSSLAARPDQSQVELVTASGKGVLGPSLRLEVNALQLLASTDYRTGHIDLLSIPLPNVTIAAELLPPDGIELRDLTVSIAEPTDAEILIRTDNALAMKARVPLKLSWSVTLPTGGIYRLGDVLTPPVDLALDVEERTEGLVTTVSAACMGECWKADGVLAIRDAKVAVVADAAISER
jgi:hypothetical protein